MAPIEVVISGIGGHFPRSNTLQEFSDNLLAGESLLERVRRWPPGALGTPELMGQTDKYEKFDYTFFGMLYVLATQTDPLSRIGIENAFEALVDAGVNPSCVRGTSAQVFSATYQQEGDCTFDSFINATGYTIMGRNRCMLSNRISYYFNLTGRSASYDACGGWVGTGLALAREAIQSGECDSAFVLGASLCVFQEICRQRQIMGLVSPDRTCHPFDIRANGYTRGDAQVAFFVQRADLAKRSYGTIVAADSQTQGILPNWFLSINEHHLREFVTSLYRKNGVDPHKIRLLEADGLCNKDMVECELNVLDEILNSGRSIDNPLLLGSVKTITGDTEGAAGHVSLTKLLLAMDTGIISPTLDCGELNPNIPGLIEGRYKVVGELTKWDVTPETHVALSSVTFSGLVSHVVLKANGRSKDTNVLNDYPLPYLILISGRNKNIVEKSLLKVMSSPFDPEYLRLTQEFFAPTIHKYEWRGYGFHAEEKFVIQRENRRPIWFVFSGMGSQWNGMGTALMEFPIVKETLERLHKLLEPKGVDLLEIITSPDPKIFDNILNSFVGITSIQIALTNLLYQLGIRPDGIIGHSVGELGCSYADDCLTEEQTILAAYARGVASLQADLIPGLMAAVGMGYKEVQKFLPPEVVVACRNSKDSCTLSGPTEAVNEVSASLREKGIFVKGVNVSNIAYHSPYIKPAAPYLLDFLRQVITEPRLRSSKWVCTSMPEEKWDTDEVRYCSAEYHTNNLLNPVLFEEGSSHIPRNALVIEIAPHGLLQAILKRSLGCDVVNVPLTSRGAVSPVKFLLEAVGKFFLEGLSPKIWHLYPDVPLPVSRNTPSLAPLIDWEHDEDFRLSDFIALACYATPYELNYSSPSMDIVGQKILLPSYALFTVWDTLATLRREELSKMPVVFQDVHFYDFVKLKPKEIIDLSSTIAQGSGDFEITANEQLVAKGKIHLLDKQAFKLMNLPPVSKTTGLSLDSNDIYAEIKSRCLGFSDAGKNIRKLQFAPHDWLAEVDFDGDWTRLLNSLLFLYQFRHSEDLQNPSYISQIRRLIIDPTKIENFDLTARLHLATSTLVYNGIELSRVNFRNLEWPRSKTEPVSLQFVPYGQTNLKSDHEFLSHFVQLSLQKRLLSAPVFKIYDFDGEHSSISTKLREIVTSEFSFDCEIVNEPRDASLILCGVSSIRAVAPIIASEDILLLSRCSQAQRKGLETTLITLSLQTVAECHSDRDGHASYLLGITNLLPPVRSSGYKVIKMGPVDRVPTKLEESSDNLIILVWENGCKQPLERIFNEVVTVQCAEKIRLFFLFTESAVKFSLGHPLFSKQIRLNVPVNIYINGKWGDYRMIPLPNKSHQAVTLNVSDNPHDNANRNTDAKLMVSHVGLTTERRTTAKESSMLWNRSLDFSGETADNQRVMGVANCSPPGCFSRDPTLVWEVPNNWSLEEAATVPYAYATAYMILFERIALKNEETVFVSCPLSPLGQAVINIAFSKNCVVIALVSSTDQRDCLQKIFPQIKPNLIIVSATDSFIGPLKKMYPDGVSVILSDFTESRLRAATYCVGSSGRFIQVGEDNMLTPDYIGMFVFTKAAALFGMTEEKLLNSPFEVKERIASWLRKGLEDGVVCPNALRRKYPGDNVNEAILTPQEGDFSKRIICLQEGKHEDKSKMVSVPFGGVNANIVIVGGSKTQWLRLVHWLARNGSKNILVVPEKSSPNLISRHRKILKQEFGTELTELRNMKTAAQLLNHTSKMGSVEIVFVFSQNDFAVELVHELNSRSMKNTQLIFFGKESSYFSRMCYRWAQEGLKVRAAIGVEDVPSDTVTPVLSWLLSPSAPPVSVLSGPTFLFRKLDFTSLGDARLLPTSAAELRELGASVRGKTAPIFRQVVTLCTSAYQTLEIYPLFFIKGIHGRANSEFKKLCSKILAPVYEVTLPAHCGGLEETAQAVVEGMQKLQSRGPYNLACDSIRSDVTMRAARLLEDKGHASVVFLLGEPVDAIRKELNILQKGNKLNITLLKSVLFEDVALQDWKELKLNKFSWREQVSTTMSKIPSLEGTDLEDVVIALDHVKDSVSHIIQGQEKISLDHGIVHSLMKGDEYREYVLGNRCFDHTIPSSKLKDKEGADILSANLATPVLQLNFDRARGKEAFVS